MLSRSALVVIRMVSSPRDAANGVAAEGQRQAGLLAPPLAEVERFDQAVVAVGELAFVDDEAGVELARDDRGNDLVEGDGDGLDLGGEELEREEGGGQRAGHRDARLLDVGERELARRDHHGAVALAHGAAAGHQGVGLLHVRIGVEGDGGDIVEGLVDGALVERLNVGQGMGELEARNAHFVGGEAVEHKGVVGVGAVGDGDFLDGGSGAGECHRIAVPRQSGSVNERIGVCLAIGGISLQGRAIRVPRGIGYVDCIGGPFSIALKPIKRHNQFLGGSAI